MQLAFQHTGVNVKEPTSSLVVGTVLGAGPPQVSRDTSVMLVLVSLELAHLLTDEASESDDEHHNKCITRTL